MLSQESCRCPAGAPYSKHVHERIRLFSAPGGILGRRGQVSRHLPKPTPCRRPTYAYHHQVRGLPWFYK